MSNSIQLAADAACSASGQRLTQEKRIAELEQELEKFKVWVAELAKVVEELSED